MSRDQDSLFAAIALAAFLARIERVLLLAPVAGSFVGRRTIARMLFFHQPLLLRPCPETIEVPVSR